VRSRCSGRWVNHPSRTEQVSLSFAAPAAAAARLGVASMEAKELHDEGIEFHPLPVPPDERK